MKERRGEGRHDISLACADSSSFVTVAAINNSGVLSLWIIRVGLRWAVARVAHVYTIGVGFRSIRFSLGGGDTGRENYADNDDDDDDGDEDSVRYIRRIGKARR